MKRNRRRVPRWPSVLGRVLRAGWMLLVVAALGMAAVGGFAAAKAHPYFAVREIDVEARGPLDAKTILGWSGLATGMSVWDVGTRQAEARLLAHPRIRAASVTRDLPGRVRLGVGERAPIALVLGDPLQMIAADGVAFPPCEGEALIGLPYVSGFAGKDLASGAVVARLRDAARLVVAWHAHEQWPALSEVRPDGDELVVFASGAPLSVRFSPSAGDDEFAKLGAVLELWKGRERALAAVDVSMAGEAVLKVRSTKAGAARRSPKAPAIARPPARGLLSVADHPMHGARVKRPRGSST